MRGKSSNVPIGSVFGKLTTVSEPWTVRTSRKNKPVRHRRWVVVKCTCGSEFPVRVESLMMGHSKSCGCFRSELHRNIVGRKTCKFCGLPNCPAVVSDLGADCTIANSVLMGIASRQAREEARC